MKIRWVIGLGVAVLCLGVAGLVFGPMIARAHLKKKLLAHQVMVTRESFQARLDSIKKANADSRHDYQRAALTEGIRVLSAVPGPTLETPHLLSATLSKGYEGPRIVQVMWLETGFEVAGLEVGFGDGTWVWLEVSPEWPEERKVFYGSGAERVLTVDVVESEKIGVKGAYPDKVPTIGMPGDVLQRIERVRVRTKKGVVSNEMKLHRYEGV